ncbi:hypothetical protein DFH27DRAFT_284468 [Peziza echinospora]|nr:hypothetical protein DFH27DRAFT_284468 [Peziza echinospora]
MTSKNDEVAADENMFEDKHEPVPYSPVRVKAPINNAAAGPLAKGRLKGVKSKPIPKAPGSEQRDAEASPQDIYSHIAQLERDLQSRNTVIAKLKEEIERNSAKDFTTEGSKLDKRLCALFERRIGQWVFSTYISPFLIEELPYPTPRLDPENNAELLRYMPQLRRKQGENGLFPEVKIDSEDVRGYLYEAVVSGIIQREIFGKFLLGLVDKEYNSLLEVMEFKAEEDKTEWHVRTADGITRPATFQTKVNLRLDDIASKILMCLSPFSPKIKDFAKQAKKTLTALVLKEAASLAIETGKLPATYRHLISDSARNEFYSLRDANIVKLTKDDASTFWKSVQSGDRFVLVVSPCISRPIKGKDGLGVLVANSRLWLIN